MSQRVTLYASGTATGLTVDAFWRLVQNVNWPSFLNFVGCVVTTGFSWYIAWRQMRRDQDAKDRQTEREQWLADELAKLKLEQERSGHHQAPPPAGPASSADSPGSPRS